MCLGIITCHPKPEYVDNCCMGDTVNCRFEYGTACST